MNNTKKNDGRNTIRPLRELIEEILVNIQEINQNNHLKQPIPKPDLDEGWIKAQDVQYSFGISKNTLIQILDSVKLPYTQFGNKYLFKKEDLKSLLTSNYTNTTTGSHEDK